MRPVGALVGLVLLLATPSLAFLDDLARAEPGVSRRASTWDRTGGNVDRVAIPAGGSHTVLEVEGAGCVRHIWFTARDGDASYLSALRIRAFWDGEEAPSVDVPFGPFFCLGHDQVRDVVSIPIAVFRAPHEPDRAAFNCYFPMPFARGARIEVVNEDDEELPVFYAQVDYVAYPSPRYVRGLGRFCATHRFEHTAPEGVEANLGGEGNYVILEAEGPGKYVGCSLSVVSRPDEPGKWYEGDDMIFVDGERWPPACHGTGTEDYFGMAWGYRREACYPFFGTSVLLRGPEDTYFGGRITTYRFHLADPVLFRRSIRVTLEHGHACDAGNLYSSVAYWYRLR